MTNEKQGCDKIYYKKTTKQKSKLRQNLTFLNTDLENPRL